MRLHHLSVSAFGPFADTVEVDLDELGEAGLFLLTGKTGSGKSSVLDAICFAIYGVVPGTRGSVKQLRSDHASPDAESVVELELTLAGRRFRFRRTPAWERPKRRGHGTTRQQPSVRVEELRAGEWTVLTTRMDDAGHLATELLGMQPDQFMQVAMLPQGGFAAFLHAGSADRQRVLQQLFRTDRFASVERWLAERRVQLRRESRVHHDALSALVSRVLEAEGAHLPDDWDLADLSAPVRDSTLLPWVDELGGAARHRADTSATTASEADADLLSSTEELATARQLDALRGRAHSARTQLEALAHRSPDIDGLRRDLDAHERARDAAGVASALATARARVEEHCAREASLRQRLHDDHDLTATSGLDLADDREAAVGRVRDLESREQTAADLVEARARLEAADAALRQATTRLAALETDATELPSLLAEARARFTEDSAGGALVESRTAEVARWRAARTAAARAVEVTEAIEALQERERAQVDQVQSAREHWLQIREERLNGMAGELAGQLAAGCGCPVCGSESHPAPAQVTSTATKEAEDAARRAYEDRDFALGVLREEHSMLVTERAALISSSEGVSVDDLTARLDGALATLAEATEARATADRLRGEVDDLALRVQRQAEAIETQRADHATAERESALARQRVDDLSDRLGAEFADSDDPVARVASVLESARRLVNDLDALTTVAEELSSARAEHDRLHDAATGAARSAGFADLAAALAARRNEQRVHEWRAEIDSHDREVTRCHDVLADPEIAAALAAPEADIRTLEVALADSTHARDLAVTAAAHHRRVADRLAQLRAEISSAVTAWLPNLSSLDTAVEVAALAEGTSPDNALKVRLSAYVLGEQLRKVVAAANDRLSRMGRDRFELEQSDQRGAGEQRGGLSLRIRDAWTNTTRDPATLSGGETFVVSLALALGLADVVTQESGGVAVDTLFIDEGFGSLDADTLEDVLDTLDGLREGGRVIGLVSHVAEMRERISAQLRVEGGPRGSTLRTALDA